MLFIFLFVFFFFFFFNDTATTEIYTLSLHDAPPIGRSATCCPEWASHTLAPAPGENEWLDRKSTRLLQSPCNLVCRLLLEKKKNNNKMLSFGINIETSQYNNRIT